MALGHVSAYGKDDIWVFHVTERVAHCSSSDGGRQTGDGGCVSTSTAVVDVISSKAGTHKFLHGVGGFMGSSA